MTMPNIAGRVFDTPLLAAPAKAASFVMGLGPRITGGKVEITGPGAAEGAHVPPSNKPFASLLDDRLGEEIRSGKRGAYRVIDQAAVIPITGTLVHRGAWTGSFSGETSYEGIAAQITAAAEDNYVRGIALEIDSHGGEVAGCFDLADLIREVSADKPVWAFICDHAYSAAYSIASQASRVVIPRTGGAGSIGVICMHADYSGRLADMGVNVTIIAAGEHKADGNPYEPLPEDVREDLQREMETLRKIFAETIAAGRGASLDAAAALATEARCFVGADAVATGLADEVASPREAFGRFCAQINGRDSASKIMASKETIPMADKTKTGATDPATKPDAPAAAQPVPDTAATQEAASEASQPAPAPEAAAPAATTPAAPQVDQKARIAAILNCEEAKGREELAKSLAFNSDMSAEEAKTHLAAASKAAPAQALSAAMSAEETDLDMPAGDPGASANPVADAMKRRYAN